MAAETLARFRGNRSDAPDDHDQRRRRRRDGRRRGRARRRRRCAHARATTCAQAGRRAAGDLVARQPDRHHRRRAGRALHRRRCRPCSTTPTPARCCSCMRRPRSCAATTSRAPARRWRAQAAGPRDGLLARRRRAWPRRARIFEEAGVADYETPEEAVRAFAMLRTYRRNQELLHRGADRQREPPTPDTRGARARSSSGARRAAASCSTSSKPRRCSQAYGIPIVPTRRRRRRRRRRGRRGTRRSAIPVALKILSPDITHKSRCRRRRLDLRDDAAVRMAAERDARARARAPSPQARIDGFTVQPMVRRPHAHELIVGASIDAVFGPVILFGQGGTAVEVLADRAIGAAAAEPRAGARAGVAHARGALLGRLPRPPAGAASTPICDVLIAVSQMLADLPELAELDINPLLADERRRDRARRARARQRAAAGAGADRFAIRPYPAELAETWSWAGTADPGAPDPARRRGAAPRLRRAARRPRTFACASSSRARELPRSELARLTQIDYDREMAFIAPSHGPTARPRRSASCARSPTPTTSRPSSRSSCAPTSRAAASAGCCSTR